MALLGITRGREEKRRAIEAETRHFRDDVNQSIQAIQSGAAVMKNMAGMNRLVREAGRARDHE